MDFRVLGPVEIRDGQRIIDAGPPQRRVVLAALLADAMRVVPVQTLITRVWGEDPPAGARRALHAHITRLRGTLAGTGAPGDGPLLAHRSGGYVLQADPDTIDLHRFRRLLDQARDEARDPARGARQRADVLGEAIGLWRGEPLAALPGAWAERTRRSWRQEHLDATIAWAQAHTEGGRPASAIGPLTELAAEYPLAEPLTAALIQALHAAGHTAAALKAYRAVRRRLAEDLGTDPGPELQALHQTILRSPAGPPVPGPAAPATSAASAAPAAPAPAAPAPAAPLSAAPLSAAPAAPAGAVAARRPAAGGSPTRVPAQLPAAVHGFTGRAAEIAELDALLQHALHGGSPTWDRTPATVVISAIAGTAGVGKTALAIAWARRVAGCFPDGQLYVNLRGFDPGGQVADPAHALRGFLSALGVPAQRIPAELDAQAALYRSELAGRQVLILLDNARDTAQVRPLLPAAPGCVALITSRNQLTGLIATDGAHPITLDLLALDEARQLLAHRLGEDRTKAETDAVEEIITCCARLPLALAVAAARAATCPNLPLAALAAELRQSATRLAALTTDDQAGDIQAVFSWSYHALSPAAARLFRLLSLHPGPDITVPAAASLSALAAQRARALLADLTRASMLTEHTPGRYSFHDLLRAYASHLTGTTDSEADRQAATLRLLDHYLHTAHTAARLLDPTRDPITLAPPRPGVSPETPTDYNQAQAWLTAEHAVLLAAVEHAAATGQDTHAWQLAWTLATYLGRRGHWHDWAAAQRVALAATQRLADPTAQAFAHRDLALAHLKLGRYDEAHTHLRHALELYRQIGDQVGQAHIHYNLGVAWGLQGRDAEALEEDRQALDLYRGAAHRIGQARALNALGWDHAQLGNHQQALAHCEQALSLHRELGNRHGQACTWDSIGYAHRALGDLPRAITSYLHALDLRQLLGDRHPEAETLVSLGDIYHAAGDPRAARAAWHRALTILTDLDHPDAESLHAKLTTPDPRSDPRPAAT